MAARSAVKIIEVIKSLSQSLCKYTNLILNTQICDKNIYVIYLNIKYIYLCNPIFFRIFE